MNYLRGVVTLITMLLFVTACGHRVTSNYPGQNVDITDPQSTDAQVRTGTNTHLVPITSRNLPRNLSSNRETRVLNNNFIPTNNPALDTALIEAVLFVDASTSDKTTVEYSKLFFDNFQIVGYSVFHYAKSLKVKNIKAFAQAFNSNVVIYKEVYNAYSHDYTIEILYLIGDLRARNLFLNQDRKRSIPLSDTLKNIKNHNVHKSITEQYRLNYIDTNGQKYVSNSQGSLISTANSDPDYQQTQYAQKLHARLENVVGLWIDIHDKTLYSIHEIKPPQQGTNSLRTWFTPVPSVGGNPVKYYGAYIVLPDANAVDQYNGRRNVNVENIFAWHDEDLKFQFNSSGNYGLYVNLNKMPEDSIINVYPEKGVLMIARDNGEIRYLIPYDINLDPSFVNKLIKDLPSYVPPVDGSKTLASHSGSGLYAWALSGSVILLTLGLLSFF